MKLSVIIPVYNEERFIGTVVERVQRVSLPAPLTREIVIVNDGSTDSTPDILKRIHKSPDIRIFHHTANRGKARAVKTGIRKSRGEIILIQDADLELDPQDYPSLLHPILQKEASVVYGSRFKGLIRDMPLINRIANQISNLTINYLLKTRLSDVNTCYKVFRREVLEKIKLEARHFAFDAEVTAKLLRQGFAIVEVPISYQGRACSEGKKMNWLRALQVYWGILRYSLKGDSFEKHPRHAYPKPSPQIMGSD